MGYTPIPNNRQETVSLLTSKPTCPECKSTQVTTDHETGETCCTGCGMVLSTTTNDSELEPGGPLYSEPSCTLGSYFGRGNTTWRYSDTNKHFAKSPQARFNNEKYVVKNRRLERLQQFIRCDAVPDSVVIANSIISGIVQRLGLKPAITLEANNFFVSAQAKRLVYGRTIAATAAACVYAACRMQKLPHAIDEISIAADIHTAGDGKCKQSVEDAYRVLVNGLELTVPAYDPADFIAPIASALGLREVTVRRAHELMAQVKAKHLHVGRDPKVLAGGVLRILTHENNPSAEAEDVRIMQEMQQATGRTASAINNMARDIREKVQAQ